MAPTILIVGATGNTGKSVVSTLPKLLESSKTLSGHRILALTRSLNSSSAQELAKIPGVEWVEKNWVDITASWLREQGVTRAFIASHNEPPHFAHESTFHCEALAAGVKYVVRISTTAANVRPDCPAYYPRAHWAIEQLLGSPEYEAMHWSSLQPNIFIPLYLSSAAEFIKQYRQTGKQSTLRLMASPEAKVGAIDPYDVGVFAAHLLALDDTTPVNKFKYILNGPEDITGSQIVEMVESYIQTKVEDVKFKDMSFIDQIVTHAPDDFKSLLKSLGRAAETLWDGKCSTSTTSKEVFDIAAPKRTPAQVMKTLLGE